MLNQLVWLLCVLLTLCILCIGSVLVWSFMSVHLFPWQYLCESCVSCVSNFKCTLNACLCIDWGWDGCSRPLSRSLWPVTDFSHRFEMAENAKMAVTFQDLNYGDWTETSINQTTWVQLFILISPQILSIFFYVCFPLLYPSTSSA